MYSGRTIHIVKKLLNGSLYSIVYCSEFRTVLYCHSVLGMSCEGQDRKEIHLFVYEIIFFSKHIFKLVLFPNRSLVETSQI